MRTTLHLEAIYFGRSQGFPSKVRSSRSSSQAFPSGFATKIVSKQVLHIDGGSQARLPSKVAERFQVPKQDADASSGQEKRELMDMIDEKDH